MDVSIKSHNGITEGNVELPASKSISNRVLIIRALCENHFEIKNLSGSDDTNILLNALNAGDTTINIGHAGTAMRFLTAYLSVTPGTWQLTGSERMKNRPVAKLVDALRKMGADIEYLNKEGYPPLSIKGKQLDCDTVTIDGSVSSQYISALMMIAPVLPNGLTIHLENQVISSSYIRMTLALMKHFGADGYFCGDEIRIEKGRYRPAPYTVEADWSAASYWYEAAFLSNASNIFIKGLKQESLQGDAVISQLFGKLGVHSEFTDQGVFIRRKSSGVEKLDYNFIDCPDMVQTFAVALSLKGLPFRFSGTQSLRIKETDRIAALGDELDKFGVNLNYAPEGILSYSGGKEANDTSDIIIDTYQDHRMAMSFASAALITGKLIVRDSNVVNKSYPGFWENLKNIGLIVEIIT